MNSVNGPRSPWVWVAQWIELPPAVRELFVSFWSIHLSHFVTEPKILQLYSLISHDSRWLQKCWSYPYAGHLSKTEIIHFSSRFSPPEPIASIKVGHHNVQPTSVIKNLGVTLDSHLTFVPHVNNICRALSRSFHSIGRIRKYLSQADTERIVHAFVLSKLDYCNSLLYGLPSREIEKLQRLQNTAARLTVCMKKTDHITPVLKKLHWLPVNDRITFKLLLLTYKSLNGLAPVYINELLYHYTPCRSLRSSDSNFLAIPKTTTITYGDRSFAAIAPKLWNQLPLAIRQSDSVDSFKRAMKTYLFRESSLFWVVKSIETFYM